MKVVLLESDESVAKKMLQSMRENDIEICGYSDNGRNGLTIIENKNPDAVLMSSVLKDLDGFAVLKQLKNKSCAILMTGEFTDEQIIRKILSAGAGYYLVKPFSPNVAIDRLFQLVQQEKESINSVVRGKKISLDERISKIFISIGIPPNIMGYTYLRDGIKIAVREPSIINGITKKLYPSIAEHFSTSASKVERAIRHSIEVAWNRQRIEEINAIFGAKVYLGTDKPTNSEFIALVADKLILDNLND